MTNLTMADMSRVHRFAPGDRVEFDDGAGSKYEGTVTGFGNEEQTYLKIDFDDETLGSAILTEDELRRIPREPNYDNV